VVQPLTVALVVVDTGADLVFEITRQMVVFQQTSGLPGLMPAFNFGVGYGYLLGCNIMFILSLLAILMIASSRAGLNRTARRTLHHRDGEAGFGRWRCPGPGHCRNPVRPGQP